MPRFVLGLTCALLGLTVATAWDNWHTGRATHYGGAGDPWTIHNGHCGYGYLDPNVGTGWDICAPSDQNWDFDASTSSCGVCYEIACQSMQFGDYYGNWLDRDGVCYDESASVVVMVTDLCPCNYPANAYSNKRWCCGDMQHFDISVFAYEKLADVKWGVIGIKYRRVSCDYKPEKRAYRPNYAAAAYETTPAPWGWSSEKDKRWTLFNNNGATWASTSAYASAQGSSSSASASASSSSSSWSSSSTQSQGSTLSNIYWGGSMQGWNDASWGSMKWGRDSSWGPNGQQAYCTTLQGFGAVAFTGWSGAFSSKRFFEFFVRKNDDGQIPDVMVELQSPQGNCKSQDLRSYQPQEWNADWAKIVIMLDAFDWHVGSPSGNGFTGCSSSISDWVVDRFNIQNKWGGNQFLCIDQIKLY